ncbi:PP0621 family protein [Chitinivorax sp. B]|uniref:PP0621 family protein n=1 Tax=Chitinivorax sp. B TaxID=2502235 RepID=UPI0010FA5AA5|nr:PP0621 family protein [Chitinivorax sp. B]
MLIRILILLVIGYLIWRWFRAREQSTKPPEIRPATQLVQCNHCHTLIPESESTKVGQRVYCSEEHAKHHQDVS